MELIEFGTIAHIKKGKKPLRQIDHAQDGYLPYVDIEAFETGNIKAYSDGEKCLLCKAGEILIVCDGSRSGYVGRAIDGYVGSTLAVISADGMTKEYLYYFLKGKYALLNSKQKGTGTPHLDQQVLFKQKLSVPSVDEQKRIVARIEELFSALDNGVETLRKTKQQLAVYRQAVLTTAFEGDYLRVPLKQISKAISGFAFKSKLYSTDGKYIVVKIGNVKLHRFDFSRDLTRTNETDTAVLRKYLLQKGDCLLTLTGSRGKRDYGYVAMVADQDNYLLNQRVAALRFDTTIALPEFYQYYLSSSEYRNEFFSYETGNVGQGNVGINALTEPLELCQALHRQREIVDEIEAKLSVCDSIEKTVETALQQAEAMRQSILKQAFEGRL